MFARLRRDGQDREIAKTERLCGKRETGGKSKQLVYSEKRRLLGESVVGFYAINSDSSTKFDQKYFGGLKSLALKLKIVDQLPHPASLRRQEVADQTTYWPLCLPFVV